MKKLLFVFALTLVLFGCSGEPGDFDSPVQSSGTTGSYSTEPFVQTAEPTVSATSAEVAETTAPQTTEQTFEKLEISAGSYRNTYISNIFFEQMGYWLYVPKNAHAEMPLVIFLHGKQEIGKIAEIENYGMIKKAREIYGDEFPFIAVNPCLPSDSWTFGNYPALLKELIDFISAEYRIDQSKIILTGHSLGSIGTWFMLSQYGDFFSAAVPVSCGCDEILNYENMAQVPVWSFVGDADEYEIRYKVGMERIVKRLSEFGAEASLTVLEGRNHGQTTTEAYTLEIFDWMLSQ